MADVEPIRGRGTVGYLGVTEVPQSDGSSKYQARLTLVSGEPQADLGTYDTAFEAGVVVAAKKRSLIADPDAAATRSKPKVERQKRGSKLERCASLRRAQHSP